MLITTSSETMQKEMALCISLLSKVDELRAVSEATKPDIICIVETWLDKHIPNNEFF